MYIGEWVLAYFCARFFPYCVYMQIYLCWLNGFFQISAKYQWNIKFIKLNSVFIFLLDWLKKKKNKQTKMKKLILFWSESHMATLEYITSSVPLAFCKTTWNKGEKLQGVCWNLSWKHFRRTAVWLANIKIQSEHVVETQLTVIVSIMLFHVNVRKKHS